METKEVKRGKFALPNETITVKFIKRKKGLAANVGDDHVISGGMLSGSKRKYSAPLQKNGSIANVLSKDEKDYLENVTGLNLSVYGDFWQTFYVSLFKDDANNLFDLSKPMDYISVAVLKSLVDDIAPTWADRKKKGTYDFVITGSDEEFKEKKAKLDVKKTAFKMYGKIEDNKDKLIGVLKLLSNQPISDDSSLDWIQGKVEEYLDTSPKLFLDIIEDPSFDTKVLINKAVESGYIKRNGNLYQTVDGLELAEAGQPASFDNAVRYLDNDKYQEVRLLIEARINTKK
jgi:hypothetical protein